jgi:methyl-accepting chemotaxis protein
MLKRLKIGPKLLLAPGVVLLLLVVLSSAAYYAMVRQNDSLEVIVQQRAVHMRSAADLVATAQKAHAGIYQLLAWISGSFPRTRTDPLMAAIHSQHAEVRRGFDQLERMTASNSAERRYVEQAAAAWRVYVRAVLDVMELARNDQSISANAMLKAESAFVVVAQRLTELSRLEQELSGAASASAAEDFRLTSILMPMVVLLSICLSLAITVSVRRSLLDEIKGIGAAAVDLASGNLTIKDRVYGNDEIAETSRVLDDSIRNLNGTLRTILESARSIGSASREISLGSLSMTSRAVFRASSFEHTASSMQELAATVHLTADSVQEAHRLAASANSVAQEGSGVVDRLVGTMESVRGSARRVAEIIDQIDGIASETGTLALNAAVEAARAGTQGRGFAVVASEVRTLAQKSAVAAKDIESLIAQSVSSVKNGAELVSRSGEVIDSIISSVNKVNTLMEQISVASEEQSRGISQVGQAVTEMDGVTQQNAALVQQSAAAAASLEEQAQQLSRSISSFSLPVQA